MASDLSSVEPSIYAIVSPRAWAEAKSLFKEIIFAGQSADLPRSTSRLEASLLCPAATVF